MWTQDHLEQPLLAAALALLQLSCAKPMVPGSGRRVSRSYLWNSRFVKALILGLHRGWCIPAGVCPCFLECNPGTLSASLFYKKGTYPQNS